MILQVRRVQSGSPNPYNDSASSYGAARDWSVWWLAPGSIQEVNGDNRDASVVVWTVGAPVSEDAPGEYDRVVVDGDEFDVNGRPADWTRGPFDNPSAGLIVELRRVGG